MRHWLLVLLIALLPLRGWAGDAMALAMLAAPAGHGAAAAAPPPCHDLAPPAQPHGDMDMATASSAMPDMAHGSAATDDAHHAGSDAHPHQTCEVCNGPAMALATPTGAMAPQVHARQPAASDRFASSEPRLGQKPPIS